MRKILIDGPIEIQQEGTGHWVISARVIPAWSIGGPGLIVEVVEGRDYNLDFAIMKLGMRILYVDKSDAEVR